MQIYKIWNIKERNMKTIFNEGRHVFSNNQWYIRMRPCDKNHKTHCGLRLIEFLTIDDQVFAGPFKSKSSLNKWFYAFISRYATYRNIPHDYIPETILLHK